ncbi:MAG: YiiX/YebB-like N1pC/P60 family cysteine hydrolase [Ginsengibacter sp.]
MTFSNYMIPVLLMISIVSCDQEPANISIKDATVATPHSSTNHLPDSIRNICEPGDLLLRLGNDFISDRIRFLSIKDHSYSHAGIVVMRNNKKMVCHIYPEDFSTPADTVRYDPVDSFLNVKMNLKCALYRYDLSGSEKVNLELALNKFHDQKVHFDEVYELQTNNRLYCSEMIYKALKSATRNRIVIEPSLIPENMQHIVTDYFRKYSPDKKVISTRSFIPIDNLYMNPHCRLIAKFTLRETP